MKSRLPPEAMKHVKAVSLQVAEQLDHRQVPAVPQTPPEGRVGCASEERFGGRRILLHRLVGEGPENPAHQHLHVAVVARIVLLDHAAEPRVILLVSSLPRLLLSQ